MTRPQRDTLADGAQPSSARGREARGTWHARTVTTTPDTSPAPGGPRGQAGSAGPGMASVRRVLDRLGVHTVLGRDVALAAVWALVTVAFLATLLAAGEFYGANRSIPTAQIVAVIVLALVQHVPLALRRVRPVTALLAVAVLQAALLAVLPTGLALWTAAPVVTAYTVATLRPTRDVVGAVLAAVGIEAVGAAVGASAIVKDQLGAPAGLGEVGVVVEALALVSSAVLINGVSAAVGSWVALRRAHDRDARARAAESVEHQATLTRAAVAAERTRMARELHDVAAHHLTGLVVQAGAAERLVDGDPERAKESLRSVRAQGRETLDALRSIVGILRETGDGPSGTVPVPGLGDVADLVDQARASGAVVDSHVDGTLPSLAPLADVTAYRTVQEALVNARRHAPGATVELHLTATAGSLVIVVENDLPVARDTSGGGGFGLVGMRERADLIGGRLDTGATADGRWRVRLELPVEAEASAEAPAGGPSATAAASGADGGAASGPTSGLRPGPDTGTTGGGAE
ncbi:histidine kinase [Frigoribacterium sp. Leaf8]|uniref:sensor histidine kinase n=1 Tax=Frigoribacterium sp. Leaf8 TaxID=1735673 RepID=UPI0009EBDA52|nr:histidine kinase [Frigoribacterium sp. Leaf8]